MKMEWCVVNNSDKTLNLVAEMRQVQANCSSFPIVVKIYVTELKISVPCY